MSELITVTGVVLSTMPIGEYDKRLVLLTRERGKITAFARGARRPSSPLLAAANPFVFGSFSLYEGRSSYNLSQVSVMHHFTELAGEQPGVYYGFYFLEVAGHFAQENTDEKWMINLLYVTLKALLNPQLDNALIRSIYELKTMVIQGEYPQMFACNECGDTEDLCYYSREANGVLCAGCGPQNTSAERIDPSTLYAMQYIISAQLEKLYTFTVTPQVQQNLARIVQHWMQVHLDHRPRSLDILEMML